MHKWLDILKTLAPVILMLAPGVPPALIPIISTGIAEAEAMKGATGAEKKAHVLNLVTLGVTGMNAAAKKVVLEPAHVSDTVSGGIDTVVSTINLVHEATGPKG